MLEKTALRAQKAILLDRSSFSVTGIRERGRALLDLDVRECVRGGEQRVSCLFPPPATGETGACYAVALSRCLRKLRMCLLIDRTNR